MAKDVNKGAYGLDAKQFLQGDWKITGFNKKIIEPNWNNVHV